MRKENSKIKRENQLKRHIPFAAGFVLYLGAVLFAKVKDVLPIKDCALVAALLLALYAAQCALFTRPGRAAAALRWLMAGLTAALLMQEFQAAVTDRRVLLIYDNFKLCNTLWCLALWLMAALFLESLLRSPRAGGIFAVLLGFIVAMVNLALKQFRGDTLSMPDLSAIGTAATVADHYRLRYVPAIPVLIVLLAAALLMVWALPGEIVRTKKGWAASVLLPLAAAVFCWATPVISWTGVDCAYWWWHCNSYILTLFLQSRDSLPGKSGTFDASLAGLTEEYASDMALPAGEDAPDVVVVMSESFADLRELGIEFDADPYEAWDEITGEGLSGTLHSSVFGGRTANTEYEFLTGDSAFYFNSAIVAYNAGAIKQEISCLPGVFGALGYETVAMHPNTASAWNRETVYGLMGFDRAVFLKDYENVEYEREYVSDACNFENILAQLEDGDEAPKFIFNVSIQNHGNYEEEDFVPDVHAVNLGYESAGTDCYASLVKESNEELRAFLNELAERERKTYVLFFGDHQPKLEMNDKIYETLFGSTVNGMSWAEKEPLYEVPWLLWCSDGSLSGEGGEYDASGLQLLLSDTMGLPRTGYQKFLTDLKAEYPLVTNPTIKAADGSLLETENTDTALIPLLNTYKDAIYAHLHEAATGYGEWFSLREN